MTGRYLVSNSLPSAKVKFRVLDVTQQLLQRDLDRAPAYDQTRLVKILHDDIHGMNTGEPVDLVVADFSFGSSDEDVRLLSGLSQIGAAIHAPVIAAACP